MFERAAIRSALPLNWTQGFNPRPRLSLPLPRPVGVASDDELLVLELDETAGPPDADLVMERLALQVPAEVRLLGARPIPASPHPRWAQYEVELAGEGAENLPGRIDALLGMERCVVQRRFEAERTKTVDIRPYLLQVLWDPAAQRLAMRLAVTDSGTARPIEVLGALGLPIERLAHRIRRTQADWNLETKEP